MVCDPTAMGRSYSAATFARDLFISSERSDPPVMALIINGNFTFLFKKLRLVSISS